MWNKYNIILGYVKEVLKVTLIEECVLKILLPFIRIVIQVF
jgi:hypothetical protein